MEAKKFRFQLGQTVKHISEIHDRYPNAKFAIIGRYCLESIDNTFTNMYFVKSYNTHQVLMMEDELTEIEINQIS